LALLAFGRRRFFLICVICVICRQLLVGVGEAEHAARSISARGLFRRAGIMF